MIDQYQSNNSFLVLFLAPVRSYLEDDSVSEILINGPGDVYVERRGRLEKAEARFVSEQALRAAAANIAKSVGRILDEMHPRLDARLPDGSRVHRLEAEVCLVHHHAQAVRVGRTAHGAA